jgi:hypothetical protein
MNRANLSSIAREGRDHGARFYTSGISDYELAILRSKTGQPAIAIRRAAMKVGSDLKKIERELIAQKMDRGS